MSENTLYSIVYSNKYTIYSFVRRKLMLVTRLVDCICHSGYMRSFASNLKYKYFIFKRLSCIHSRPEGGGGRLVEYQNTQINLPIYPKINYNLCKIPKLRKLRYTLFPKLVVSEVRGTRPAYRKKFQNRHPKGWLKSIARGGHEREVPSVLILLVKFWTFRPPWNNRSYGR